MVTRKAKKLIYNTIIICLLLGGIIYVCSRFVHFGRVEYTDNAQVRQHITPVNTRVAGFIKRICFEEYKPVRKGDTLLIIEDSEFRLRLAQAEADLANALAARQATSAGIATTRNNLSVSDAGIEETRVRMVNAQREFERYEKLLAEDAVTKQQYDNVRTAYEAAKARYDQVSRAKRSTSLTEDEQTHHLSQNEAAVRLAEAAVELARLNLSYTVIVATCDGVTGHKDIHEGRLSSAVLADKGKDLALGDADRDIIGGKHTREPLGDVLHPQGSYLVVHSVKNEEQGAKPCPIVHQRVE